MTRVAPTVAAVLVATGAWLQEARACDCVSVHEVDHYANADTIFLGRAGPRFIEAGRMAQDIEVLHVLKGDPGSTVALRRPMDRSSDCDRQFLPDEVSVVLVRNGEIGLCTGNAPLATQIRDLPYYLEASGAGPSTVPVLERALDGVDPPHRVTPDHPLTLAYPPLAGATLRVGDNIAQVVDDPSADWIVSAWTAGLLHLVSIRRGRGVPDTVLLLDTPAGPEEVARGPWSLE